MPPKAAARATTALRTGTREALCEQLAAQAEMRAGFRDRREVMLDLAPFHDCCRRLGLEPADVFADVARSASPDVAAQLLAFGARTDVTLNVFGWVLEDDDGQPAYRSAIAR